MTRSFHPVWLAVVLALALLLGGCSEQEVYGGLSESSANELIATLNDAGIEANKAKVDEKWSVAVAQGDFSKAVETLRAAGLPREDYATLGSVFKKEGFTSTPLEERARLNFGLSQELSRTISEIDGVVQARVHLAMPEADPLSREAKPSAASVFVKYRVGFDLRSQTGAIKSLLANSIEGLSYDRISVVMVPARAIGQARESGNSVAMDLILRVAALVMAAIVLVWAGWSLWRSRQRRGVPMASDQQP